MKESILSVGIDIGTSTTQLIFSRLTIENRASSYTVPRIDIVDKEVIYRSDIYITPLISNREIDAEQVKKIVLGEYQKAGISPDDLRTGAVIITGETARKENADQVLEALSSLAGDFVVAAAGPDLESVLSARGAGADRISEEKRTAVANLDVGGGTTNIGLYQRGTLKGTSCLDIGGRLIKIKDGTISYIFPKIEKLAKDHGVSLEVGDPADLKKLRQVCDLMAAHLAQSIGLEEKDAHHARLYTNDGKPLTQKPTVEAITFSGGVADFIYTPCTDDYFRFGDIGPLLGAAVAEYPAFGRIQLFPAAETIRATVVGAGTHTTEVSGSTISYSQDKLPLKNIPILKISEDEEGSIETFQDAVRNQLPLFMPEGRPEQIALAFTGKGYTGFADIQALADMLAECMKEVMAKGYPLILVVETDIGKVLGNALSLRLEEGPGIICIDGIRTLSGDYIDIGEPIADGQALPVVIKTLIFNS